MQAADKHIVERRKTNQPTQQSDRRSISASKHAIISAMTASLIGDAHTPANCS
ncbi:hypothetical protein Scep_005503 [Stephania cephalantha]|uniref:Uncharacterized protein n=1 Tax=Stephania cephalantha TaxID=152367 RepID=A0AAP0KW29_9MAGN